MLNGTLDDFTLADIFKLLSFSKKTGRLELKRKAGMGRVFFRDGEVYFAESSLSREPLGQKLIRARSLTETHLRQALDEHADSGERVGQILLRDGWISEGQLESAVKQQIEDAVFDLLRWELGDFEWEPGVTLEPEVPISVSVENLIMEASRRLDELEIISRKVPSSHAVIGVAATAPEGAVEINITPEEWRVLVLVDGRRTVETIANTIGLDEFQTMQIVYGMVSAGLIEVVGVDEDGALVDAPPPPPPPPPAKEESLPAGDEHAFAPVEVEAAPPEVAPAEDASDVDVEPAVHAADEEMGGEMVEETLYDAHAAGDDDSGEVAPPPEEWFEDPELAMELFNAPSPGDLATEGPTVNGAGVVTDDDVPAAEGETGEEEHAPGDEAESAEAPEDALISDETLRALQGPDAEVEPSPERPPPPPIVEAEGADRHAAVRELAELFDDTPAGQSKRPAIRRLEGAPEATAKRRVEDDEQVTKSLISRLIEGVKGL